MNVLVAENEEREPTQTAADPYAKARDRLVTWAREDVSPVAAWRSGTCVVLVRGGGAPRTFGVQSDPVLGEEFDQWVAFIAGAQVDLSEPGRGRSWAAAKEWAVRATRRDLVVESSLETPFLTEEMALGGLVDAADLEGWEAPSTQTEATVSTLLHHLRRTVEEAGFVWRDAHASSGPTGVVALEWWNAPRDLTFYVESDSVGVVKSWGSSVSDEMSDETLHPDDGAGLLRLWRWLEMGQDGG